MEVASQFANTVMEYLFAKYFESGELGTDATIEKAKVFDKIAEVSFQMADAMIRASESRKTRHIGQTEFVNANSSGGCQDDNLTKES